VSLPPTRVHLVRRERDGLFRILARGLLLAALSSVLWGTLLFVSLLLASFADGPGVALARLDPRDEPGVVPWINAACVLLVPLSWISLAVFIARRKRD
jgi:hypothetical protein